MKKIYCAALSYLAAGLASGLFYREFTKAADFTGGSQLSLVHTHLLALTFITLGKRVSGKEAPEAALTPAN